MKGGHEGAKKWGFHQMVPWVPLPLFFGSQMGRFCRPGRHNLPFALQILLKKEFIEIDIPNPLLAEVAIKLFEELLF